MIPLTLHTIGAVDKAYKEVEKAFTERLTHLCRFEKKEHKTKEKLLENLTSSAILLDVDGQSLSSERFAAKILTPTIDQGLPLTFALGGPFGFSDKEKERFATSLSLSPMTTTHDLARIFFLEQLYRGFMIIRGTPYHY